MQQWEINENFIFPSFLGNVIGTPSIQVKPSWQQQVENESVLLNGVYVIKGHVQFDFNPIEDEQQPQGILIEHIDVEQDQAYFEYAIPFSIDFPKEEVETVTIEALSPKLVADKGSACNCSWQVQCHLEKKAPVVAETEVVEAPVVEAPVVKKAIVEKKVVEERVEEKPKKEILAEAIEMPPLVEAEQLIVEKLVIEDYKERTVAAPKEEQLVQNESLKLSTKEAKQIEEEADFFEQLAEAYSIVKVHMSKVEK